MRIRVINVLTDEVYYVTVAYVPVVRKLKEPGAEEKARLRRSAVLQRMLYLAFRTTIGASHSGVEVVVSGRSLLAFPRLLLYLADLPEEKAIMCLKSGKCAHPCTSCDVRVDQTGTASALNSLERNAISMLTTHLEVAGHRERHRNSARRADLEARTSAQSAIPALAGFAGLSTSPFLLYKMSGFDVLHVLDLGVTRTLVHRLVRVFPHMCKNHYPLCGTTSATFRIGNMRISHMGRRSLAPRLSPGFFVEEGKPQSTFTGSQQRSGIPILPFAANGLFGVGRRRPRRSATMTPAEKRARKARQRSAGTRTRPHVDAAAAAAGDAGGVRFSDNVDDDVSDLPRNFQFDWVAYHATFGTTPVQDAVTAMFAEFAVLYGRIAGWSTSTVAAPLTLDEAKDISEHAEHFVLHFVTPILGVVQTPKVHKLLRHILDAIKMHGNVQNGNTAGNEAQHKEDKVFYRRTNKTIANFTQQVVRLAQGSREVLRVINNQNEEAEKPPRGADSMVSAAAAYQLRTQGVTNQPPTGTNDSVGSSGTLATPAGGAAPDATPLVMTPVENSRRDRVRSLPRKSIAVLSQRPGLSHLGQLLCLPAVSTLKVLSGLRIAARLDCHTVFSQVVRASPAFMSKTWYDAVLMDSDDTPRHEATQHESPGMMVGEVRLLFHGAVEDMAVVCLWEAVSPVPGCPLAARSCARLRWATSEAGDDFCVRVLPARRIRRVAHVVPDFAELSRTAGVEAVPSTRTAAMADHRRMRFFINDFFPWG